MKYIEITEGFSVLKKSIIAVERKDEFYCLIHTENKIYESTFPYMTLLQLLESSTDNEEDRAITELKGMVEQMKKNQQYVSL